MQKVADKCKLSSTFGISDKKFKRNNYNTAKLEIKLTNKINKNN